MTLPCDGDGLAAFNMLHSAAKKLAGIVVARSGSPIVIGFGVGENFLASDQLALLSVTRRFMYQIGRAHV